MTAKVYLFPGAAIVAAFHELHAPTTREAEELAASVLIAALSKAEPVPPGTLNLLPVSPSATRA